MWSNNYYFAAVDYTLCMMWLSINASNADLGAIVETGTWHWFTNNTWRNYVLISTWSPNVKKQLPLQRGLSHGWWRTTIANSRLRDKGILNRIWKLQSNAKQNKHTKVNCKNIKNPEYDVVWPQLQPLNHWRALPQYEVDHNPRHWTHCHLQVQRFNVWIRAII